MKDINAWTAQDVKNAILQGNSNLEIIFSNYLKNFVLRLIDFDIPIHSLRAVEELQQQVLQGIESLEALRKEFLSVIDIFASCHHPLLAKYLCDILGKILISYEELGVNLNTGMTLETLKNDHYRFFNQSFFISLTSLLLENGCFDVLHTILFAKYPVYYKSYGTIRNERFPQFRKYNYTLNQFLNTGTPKRLSVTADYMKKYSSAYEFQRLIRADILLYYMSLFLTDKSFQEDYWHPELSVYNRDKEILPYMASKEYFDKAKVLFGVSSIDEYKHMLDHTEELLIRDGSIKVPTLKVGLLYDIVGTV